MDRKELGTRGEDAAAAYLERIGMTVEARNWRCACGEIDIIARDGQTLVLVEVKTRRSEKAGTAEEAVSPTKQKRIARLAGAYLAGVGRDEPGEVRFDVIAIRVLSEDRALLRHYRAAFDVSAS
ncbi:MAG: YraN family protein [Coriobacteriia bacterium]|nr:YraN family protein [Coriobacteriia bacterium]